MHYMFGTNKLTRIPLMQHLVQCLPRKRRPQKILEEKLLLCREFTKRSKTPLSTIRIHHLRGLHCHTKHTILHYMEVHQKPTTTKTNFMRSRTVQSESRLIQPAWNAHDTSIFVQKQIGLSRCKLKISVILLYTNSPVRAFLSLKLRCYGVGSYLVFECSYYFQSGFESRYRISQ